MAALPNELKTSIAADGIRNSHLTAVAPAGSISLLADNVSSGIEPIFQLETERRLADIDGIATLEDHAYARWCRLDGGAGSPLPDAFVTAVELTPEQHLAMQAAVQPFVDAGVAKTVNLSEDVTPERIEGIFRHACDLGLVGCTVFRPNPITGSVLSRCTPAAA